MMPRRADRALGEVRHLLAEHALAEWPDQHLLERYVRCRDAAAFAALLDRHGPTVLRVCRAVLRDGHDAEDAFQATFLVLACGAARVRNMASVGSFLHGTAYRVAIKARARALRRRSAEQEAAQMRAAATESQHAPNDLEALLHEELTRLPERLRCAFVSCHLEGQTHAQAAAALGCPAGSVSRHLRRACELLRERLAARGVIAPAGLLGVATAAKAAVPAALAQATLAAVGKYVAGSALVGGSSVPAVALAKEVLRTMTAFKLQGLAALLLLIGLTATGAGLFGRDHPPATEFVFAPAPLEIATEPGVDRHGDPLPEGAVSRLGTVRLRPGYPVGALALAPDGATVATFGYEGDVRLWSVPAGQEIGRLWAAVGTLTAFAFATDGKTLAIANNSGEIAFFDFYPAEPGEGRPGTLGKARLRFKAEGFKPEGPLADFLAFLPSGDLFGGSLDGRMVLWDRDGKEVRRCGKAVVGPQHIFAPAPDGKHVAVVVLGTEGADVVLWDMARGEEEARLPYRAKVHSLAFAPDGKSLAVGDDAHTIRLWDVATRKATADLVGKKMPEQWKGYRDAVFALAFAADGKTLVSVEDYGDGTVRVWDLPTATERRRFKSQPGDDRLLALSSDGKTVAVSGDNATVRLWDATTGTQRDAVLGSQGKVLAVAISPDSKQVATAGSDGFVRLWDRATGKEQTSFRAQTEQVFRVAYTPDGKRLFVGAIWKPIKVWDLATLKEIATFDGSRGSEYGLELLDLSPDGKQVALVSDKHVVQVVDVATRKAGPVLAKRFINRGAFSPDGKLLAGGGHDQAVHLWDVAAAKEIWSVENLYGTGAVAFSPDGRLVVVGSGGSRVIVYDTATGKEVRKITEIAYEMITGRVVSKVTGIISNVHAVAISPDGRLLAVAGDSGTVGLYELDTGQLVRQLQGHGSSYVWTLAFAPDGRSLVSGSFDATALVWDLTGQVGAKKRDPLTAAELDANWAALNATPGEAAYRALLALASDPKQAVPFVKVKLLANPVDPKMVAKMLADLDDDQYPLREKASHDLARLGRSVATEMERERATTPSAEVRHRLDTLLAKLKENDDGPKLDEAVRAQRVVAVLELAATAEAKELLEHLAKKAALADVRRQAASALDRLSKR